MGLRDGMLMLNEVRGSVTGMLQILSHDLPVYGSRGSEGELHLVHSIITAIGQYSCQSILRETGTTLTGELQMDQTDALWGRSKYQNKAVMPWSGERLEETEGTQN